MAERNILGMLILLSLHQTYAALDVSAPSIQRAFFTRDTILNCSFSVDKQPLDLNFLIVLWTFQGKVILIYDNKVFSTQDPRMSLNLESLGDGYASLHISNVSISDRGTYMCTVMYNAERKEKETSLKVFAKPLLSIQSTKVQRNTENTLTCKATGFFPPDIWITWYRNGEALRNNFMGKPQIYKDGTYHVDSTMTITPTKDDQNQTFSCKVQHDSLQEPLQEDFQLIYEDIETSSNVVIVICIVLVLMTIVAGLGTFLWRRKYREKDIGAFALLDIKGPTKLVAGEETSLYCRATNCPENTSVTWLEKKRGGEVYEIPESHGGDKEEEERLMGTQYGVISCREGPNYTSSLKFRPNITKHKGVTFICRYSRGKEKKEKTFHCRDIYAKPQLVQPVSHSLFVAGELKYLVTLEKFYPRDITIRWTDGVGDPQEALPSTETFTDNPDGTYSVYSEVRIPEELLKDPEFRVRVSWEHQSLDTPGYKDLSVRDSGKPQMVEPILITMGDSSRVVFTLNLQKFYPEKIEIKWQYEYKDRKFTMIWKNNLKKYDDLTHGVTSVGHIPMEVFNNLEIKVSVTWKHESMAIPETRTLTMRDLPWRPQVGDINIPNLKEGKQACLTCDISGYFPDHLKVIWFKKEPGTDSPPIVTELPKDAYKVSDEKKKNEKKDEKKDEKKKEQKDKTFSNKSSLTFTPSFTRDQGAEFICRVEHPTLEHPIEKRTGPISIGTLLNNKTVNR